MDVTHLHLHTRDRSASEAFYRRCFGLVADSTGSAITFMRGDQGFLLALMDDEAPEPLPSWFHFGMRMASGEAVGAKHAELAACGVSIVKPLLETPAITSFRCADPDGYAIEIYWLPD